jgi:hypothetical protein
MTLPTRLRRRRRTPRVGVLLLHLPGAIKAVTKSMDWVDEDVK